MRIVLILAFLPLAAWADAPVVEDAWIESSRVTVSLSHPDTGWSHFADGWEVVTADGSRLGLRVLAHPHEHEQPFSRSLSLDAPPPDGALFVRPRCLVDGWSADLYPLRRE